MEEARPKKRQRQQKTRKSRSKKRPVDPKRPWLDSDGEEADCALPLDDDSDDDAFLQRLVEEKEREEAEERKQKEEVSSVFSINCLMHFISVKRPFDAFSSQIA